MPENPPLGEGLHKPHTQFSLSETAWLCYLTILYELRQGRGCCTLHTTFLRGLISKAGISRNLSPRQNPSR